MAIAASPKSVNDFGDFSVEKEYFIVLVLYFLNSHALQSTILKYSNRVICCDLIFGGR